MKYKIFTAENATLKIEVADTFLKRFLGLMFRKKLNPGQGLLLTNCNSIHMFFMRFAIDVVYIDKNLCIKKIVTDLKPWIGFSLCFGASDTIELAANEAERLNLKVGQIFKVS